MRGDTDQVERTSAQRIPNLPRLRNVKFHVAGDAGGIHVIGQIGLSQRTTWTVDCFESEIERIDLVGATYLRELDINHIAPRLKRRFDCGFKCDLTD